ncbi:MAG: FecR domain-containing protein [Bacteroidales bacterium]|nr:FecR domain-containing protein [Bacteroidales bacterium]
MDNRFIDLLLRAYFSGTASPEEQDMILSWLKESEEHKAHYKECCEIWALQQLQDIADDKNTVHLNVLNRLISRLEKPHRRIWTTLGRIAAIFVLGVAIGFASVLYFNKFVPVDNHGLYTETIVPNGSRSKLRLPDGSTAWLNAGSRLTYQNNFGNDNRTVFLEGEALFEVKSDSMNPFRIKTKEIDAVVLGTILTVKAYEEDPLVEITLLEGKTTVEQLANNETIALLPDQQLTYNKESGKTNLHRVDAAKYAGWVNGKIYFADESFEILAKHLERIYDITIHINSEILKKERFYGSFDKSSGILHILKTIDIDNRFRWSFSDNNTLTVFNK